MSKKWEIKLETMKRCFSVAPFAALLLALSGVACSGTRSPVDGQNETRNQPMLSAVRMNDSTAGAQLLSGFYGIENNAWRWTARAFSVRLRTPPGAVQSGATLALAFTLPDTVIQKLNTIAITASINGAALKSDEYKTPGANVFSADVPGSLLTGESVDVDFALDKTMPPGDVDKRRLGIIAGSVSLTSK
jgi:hypothetical protein